MTRSCLDPSVLGRLDELPAAERSAGLAHVAACGRCRAQYVGDDPARIFGLLANAPIPTEVLDAVSSGVARRSQPAEKEHRRGALAVGWAAAVILAALIGATLSGPLRPIHPNGFDTVAVREPRAGVEVFSPADAKQVVDLTVGDSQVVMIFDERLRL